MRRVVVFALLLLPALAHAQGRMAWEYSRTSEPQPTRFILRYLRGGETTPQRFEVPYHGVEACAQIADVQPDTFCTQLACPPDGVYLWVVEADVEGSPPLVSAPFVCQMKRTGATCDCQPLRLPGQGNSATEPGRLQEPGGGVPPPDPLATAANLLLPIPDAVPPQAPITVPPPQQPLGQMSAPV